MAELIAFHGLSTIKDFYLARVRGHRAMDQIIKGRYWEGGKGCAIGCSIHSDDHAQYEIELGIPQILARLEDGIFENLPNERAMEWPEQFLAAIPVGADLSLVWPQFAVWLMVDPGHGVIRFAQTDEQRAVIQRVADLYQQQVDGVEVDEETWRAAAAAADAAAAARIAQADKLLELMSRAPVVEPIL